MGQITQIAFELRNLTQERENESDTDAEDEDEQHQDKEWREFCTKKIDKIERLWNRKLENSDHGSDEERGNSDVLDHDES